MNNAPVEEQEKYKIKQGWTINSGFERFAFTILRLCPEVGEPTQIAKMERYVRASEKMFYPNWLVYERVFCVAKSSHIFQYARLSAP